MARGIVFREPPIACSNCLKAVTLLLGPLYCERCGRPLCQACALPHEVEGKGCAVWAGAVVSDPSLRPGSFTAGAERGPVHTGSAQHGRWERLWLALATGMGFSLLEAAQLSHGAREGLSRARHAVGAVLADLHRRAAHAGRSLFAALLRVYGWELMPTAGAYRYKAARLDGAHSLHSDGPWWRVLRQARRFALTPEQAQALVRGSAERAAQAEAEADAANRRAFQRRESLSRLCARLRFYREAVYSEWLRRVQAEKALAQCQALLATEGHERDFATMEAGEASRRAMEAETRLGTVGAELEALGGELDGLREALASAEEAGTCWRTLFAHAAALAMLEQDTAGRWRTLAEENGRRAESFWQRPQAIRKNNLRNRRTLRHLLRSERRHAAGVRQVCRAALEQLEDVEGGWTVHGVGVRQALRRVLGLPLAPICPVCGVDWWRPVLQGDGSPCSPCRVALGEDAGTSPCPAMAQPPSPRPRRLRRASGKAVPCAVCAEPWCVKEHEGAAQ